MSLRNVTNLEQGTPEHDIVIDISESDTPVGPLRLSLVDNLLIVHCLERSPQNPQNPQIKVNQSHEQESSGSGIDWIYLDFISVTCEGWMGLG